MYGKFGGLNSNQHTYYGAPMGGAPMGGAPMGGAPMGGAPMGGAPMGVHTGTITKTMKPPAIEIRLEITLCQAYTGSTEAVVVRRWIAEGGAGQREERETLYILVPKGADDGEIIVVDGKGHISPDGVAGDVKIFLNVANKSAFQRRGLDLIHEQSLSLREALCGFSFDVCHVSGRSFTINSPKGSIVTPSYRKVVPKLGMERDGHIGNLIVEFKIVFPSKISSEVADKLEALL
jgi:DnaJ-class molecular chaperone